MTGAALDAAIVSTDGQFDDVDDDGNISDITSGDLVFGSKNDIVIVIDLRMIDSVGAVTNDQVVALQNAAGEIYVVDFVNRLVDDLMSVEVTGIGDTGGNAPATGFEAGGMYYTDSLNAVCFAAGTSIRTDQFPKTVEALEVGELVLTLDHGFQPIRMIEHRHVPNTDLQRNPKLLPIRIKAGALGQGLPRDDLCVSRQHRMLVSSNIVSRMFDQDMVLVPAINLLGTPGVAIDDLEDSVDYYHLIFDDHEIVFANDAPSESFFPGPQAIRTLNEDARAELLALFPRLARRGVRPRPVRAIPEPALQRVLVSRHAKNNQPLLQNFVPFEPSFLRETGCAKRRSSQVRMITAFNDMARAARIPCGPS